MSKDRKEKETFETAGEPQPQPEPLAQEEHPDEMDKVVEENKILAETVAKQQEELSSVKDAYLRKTADFENYRMRMIREKDELIQFGNQNLLLDLVAVLDDYERAIKSSEQSKEYDPFHEGISMIQKQFVAMLSQKWGLSKLETQGLEFDPEKHEAIACVEQEGIAATMVVEEYQCGYSLNGRVVRPAKVKVAKPLSNQTEPAKPAEQE